MSRLPFRVELIALAAAETLLLGFVLAVLRMGFPFFLVNYVLLGVAAALAVMRDTERASPYWGLMTWGVIGALVALEWVSLIIASSLGAVMPLAWGSTAAFLVVALLADWRRGRLSWLPVELLCALIAGAFHPTLLGWMYLAISRGH